MEFPHIKMGAKIENKIFKNCHRQLELVFKKYLKMVRYREHVICKVLIFLFIVSSMQRMVNQIGTHQDSPELRSQL